MFFLEMLFWEWLGYQYPHLASNAAVKDGRLLIFPLFLLIQGIWAPLFRLLGGNLTPKRKLSTNLLQDHLPRVEPLEVDNSQEEVEHGRGDDKDGQLPVQPGQ